MTLCELEAKVRGRSSLEDMLEYLQVLVCDERLRFTPSGGEAATILQSYEAFVFVSTADPEAPPEQSLGMQVHA